MTTSFFITQSGLLLADNVILASLPLAMADDLRDDLEAVYNARQFDAEHKAALSTIEDRDEEIESLENQVAELEKAVQTLDKALARAGKRAKRLGDDGWLVAMGMEDAS